MAHSLAPNRPLHRFEHRLAPYLAVVYLALGVLLMSEWAHALLAMSPNAPEQGASVEAW